MGDSGDLTLLERYQRLADISRVLASTVDLNILLNRIVRAAADLSHAQAASILLYDEIKGQLFFEATTNLEEPVMRGLIVPVDDSIAGLIVTTRQPIIIKDTRKEPRHFRHVGEVTKVTTRSLLGVPLIAKDKVVGALEAINKLMGEFSLEDQEILMDLGAQAAVAIENARLFQQSDLIAEMVHEIRTPLASLRTAAHLLSRKDVSEDQRRKVVDIIDKETTRLIEMTSAFLDLARLESGRVPFQSERFDLRALLDECVSMVNERIEQAGLHLDLSLPVDLPVFQGDRDKIKQVILNLLSNAINYNRPDGWITLEAQSKDDQVIIKIRDTGLGIRQADLVHLFDKFYRAQATEKSVPGTGLGLAISKRIVEAHNGHIRVESEVGVGTTFSVILPLMKP